MRFPCAKSYLQCFNDNSFHYGSNITFSVDIMTSLGGSINQHTKLRKYIISPCDPRYRAWEMFLIILVIYSTWLSPFELAFLRYSPNSLCIVENIVNGFFAIDIAFTFFVTYLDQKSYLLVDDHKRIAARYISSWFDLCSTVPFQPFSHLFTKHGSGLGFKRDTIQAVSAFAERNQLPRHLKEQMLSHECLRFKTEEFIHQERMDGLSKGIHSRIASYLFLPIVQNVYLFRGVPYHFLNQLVAEMQAEYFPPEEDIVLMDEVSTDLYILISGAVEFRSCAAGSEQVQGRDYAGDTFGEVGVLYNIPEPFTIRTTELSQVLRLSRKMFVNIVRESLKDGTIIMNNFLQKLETNRNLQVEYKGLGSFFQRWSNIDSVGSNQFFSSLYQEVYENPGKPVDMESKTWMAPQPSDHDQKDEAIRETTDSDLVTATQFEMMNSLFKVNMNEAQNFGCERALFKKQRQRDHEYSMKSKDNPLNKSNNNSNCQLQRNMEQEPHFRCLKPKITKHKCSEGGGHPVVSDTMRLVKPRVTIHMLSEVTHGSRENLGKLILLPESINELLIIGGKKFKGFKPTKVVNQENAEIDDITAVRDGDHVYLIQED